MPIAADGVPTWDEGRQRVLNAFEVPDRYTRARPPIPITARIVWEVDGEERMDAVADAWLNARGAEPLVLARIDDPRSIVRGVWVAAKDVRRR